MRKEARPVPVPGRMTLVAVAYNTRCQMVGRWWEPVSSVIQIRNGRIAWGPDLEAQLREEVLHHLRQGSSLGEALERFARRRNLSVSAIRSKYYHLQRKLKARGEEVLEIRPPWTPEEDEKVRLAVQQGRSQGRKLAEIFQELESQLGRSARAIRYRYYSQRSKRYRRADALTDDGDLLPEVATLLRRASRAFAYQDLAHFLRGLSQLLALAARAQEQQEHRGLLRLESDGYWQQRTAQLREQQRALNALVEDFCRRSSIEQIEGLAEFRAQLRRRVAELGRLLDGPPQLDGGMSKPGEQRHDESGQSSPQRQRRHGGPETQP